MNVLRRFEQEPSDGTDPPDVPWWEEERASLQQSLRALQTQFASERARREELEREAELLTGENAALEQQLSGMEAFRVQTLIKLTERRELGESNRNHLNQIFVDVSGQSFRAGAGGGGAPPALEVLQPPQQTRADPHDAQRGLPQPGGGQPGEECKDPPGPEALGQRAASEGRADSARLPPQDLRPRVLVRAPGGGDEVSRDLAAPRGGCPVQRPAGQV